MEAYYIVPRKEFISEVLADNADEALFRFVADMETDMNLYFKAVTAEELQEMLEQDNFDAHKNFVKEFMSDELQSSFGLDAADARNVAEDAYELYCRGDGKTEYECINDAYADFAKSHDIIE